MFLHDIDYWQMVIKGIVLILAVLIDVMRSKKR